MSMQFVEEVVVEEFLPTFRSMLAERLREAGLTQSEVAEMLGISQSAVSKYVHGEVDRNERVAADETVRALADRLAEGLAAGDLTPVEALVEAEVTVRELERGGLLAELHEDAVPALADYDAVALHDPEGRVRRTGQVRASVRRGLRVLRNTEGFADAIPAVGSNLAECLPDAETVDDVAAVPGRIIAVRGEMTVPDDPAFGVSQHVASLLLAARRAGADARAAVNVAYDPAFVEALEREGATAAAFDPEADLDTGVAAALADAPDATVLYQTGAMGVEPVVYVLGPDAAAVAERVRAALG